MRHTLRPLPPLLLLAGMLLPAPPAASQAFLNTYVICDNGPNATLSWTFYESDPPTGIPEWVGYDVYRRTLDPCSEFERRNADPFPRTLGATHSHSFYDPIPSTGTMYEYLVVRVDAQRQSIPWPQSLDDPNAFVTCPDLSAPISVGAVADFAGWAVQIQPCSGVGTCYPVGFVSGPVGDELRPYIGTGEIVRLFGDLHCGGVEGCAFTVNRWELGDCGPVPAMPVTLARLKAWYR